MPPVDPVQPVEPAKPVRSVDPAEPARPVPARPDEPGAASHGAQPSPGAGNWLPPGTRMGEFEITGLIGEGGFGIVYEARDHQLERTVAIKEYMPSAMATRTHGVMVAVKSGRHEETFETGLRSFVNEARLLAQFDHPSLVKVYRFWEANGTAYMAMPLYRGTTLRGALKELDGPPDEAWLRHLLRPLLDALETLHAANCFHRDIAPDNILVLASGRPVLLDFGAARRVIGDMTQALTVILKPGYAPIEQYANGPEMRQGPWTDVYALAAVVYYCISGRAPPPSVARLMRDTMVPAREAGRERFSEELLAAIDHALAVTIDDRTPSIAQLRLELGFEPDIVASPHRRAAPPSPDSASHSPDSARSQVDPADSATRARQEQLPRPGPEPQPARSPPSAFRTASTPAPPSSPGFDEDPEATVFVAAVPRTAIPPPPPPPPVSGNRSSSDFRRRPGAVPSAATASRTLTPVVIAVMIAVVLAAGAAIWALTGRNDSVNGQTSPSSEPGRAEQIPDVAARSPSAGSPFALPPSSGAAPSSEPLPSSVAPSSSVPAPAPEPAPAPAPEPPPAPEPAPELAPAPAPGPAPEPQPASRAALPDGRKRPPPSVSPEPERRSDAKLAAEPEPAPAAARATETKRAPEETHEVERASASTATPAPERAGPSPATPAPEREPPSAATPAPQPERAQAPMVAPEPEHRSAPEPAPAPAPPAGTTPEPAPRSPAPATPESPPVVASLEVVPAPRLTPQPPAVPTPPAAPGTAPPAAPAAGPENTSPAAPPAVPQPPPPPKVAPATEPAAFSAALALDAIYEARDPGWTINVRTDKQSLVINKDEFAFRVRSNRPGYLYLLMLGTDNSHFYLLFPNALDTDNRLRANAEMRLPRPTWSMVAGGPAGTDRLLALVSSTKRDFGPVGLGKVDPFGEFDLLAAGRAYAQGGAAALAGKPADCRDATGACARYGAARFEIRELE